MNIPLNGRIAIIDDNYNEVKPLMDLFSKQRIPFNYYTGKKNELPENPDKNPISLLFLDLNILETQHNYKSVIGTLHPILKATCPGYSKPYFLLMWSKKLNEFADHLETHFKNSIDLRNKKPAKIIRLNKSDFFDYHDGNYIFDEGKYDLLVEKLSTELDNLSILKNFLSWENVVHKNATETVSEFSSFYEIDNEWDKNTKAIIFHLAKSILGNDEIDIADDQQKLIAAFDCISTFLSDKIQISIYKKELCDAKGIIDEQFKINKKKDGLKDGIKEKVNSKLHLISNGLSINSFAQGNVYKLKNEDNLFKRILWKDKYNTSSVTDIIKSKPILVQLDLTPVCDYSQYKKYVRTIYGLLINTKLYKDIEAREDYYFKTPVFSIENKRKFILFDFRFVKTFTKNEIIKRKIAPCFKLRREICTDIQSQLSNQINRPGISNL
jgi:hypothetical protein